MKFNNIIKSLRTQHSMTQKELANKIKVSVVSVGCWENGTKQASADALISLSNLFNVSVDYLLGISEFKPNIVITKNEELLVKNYRSLDDYGKEAVNTICNIEKRRVCGSRSVFDLKNKKIPATNSKRIPLYTFPSAAGVSAPINNDNNYEMITLNTLAPKNSDFAVKIQGDSMLPLIHDGDIVYVKKNSELSIGDIGIFSVDGCMYCKQYFIDDSSNLILKSLNPEYQHTNVFVSSESTSSVKCYGKVLILR